MTSLVFLAVAVLLAAGAVAAYYWSDGGIRDGWRGGVGICGAAALALCACLCVVTAFAIPVEATTCAQHGRRAGVPSEYRSLSGCYVLVEGRWVPYDRWTPVTGS